MVNSYSFSIDAGYSWSHWWSDDPSITVGGVAPGETYSVMVKSWNRQGVSLPSSIHYVTVGEQPDSITTGASDVTASSARLEGTVDPNFVRASVEFQLILRSDFAIYTSFSAGLVSGGSASNVGLEISDLTEKTTYFYRIVSRNSLGSSTGAVMTFRTRNPLGVSIQSGAIYTNSTSVTVSLSWPRGSIAAIVSNDGGFMNQTRFSLSDSVAWVLQSSGNERLPKAVYVKFVLADGSRSSVYSDDIILDQTAPVLLGVTGSASNSSGVSIASVLSARLTINASDSNSGLGSIELRRSEGAEVVSVEVDDPGASVHYANVTSESGSLQVRVVDRAGNGSGWITSPIIAPATTSGSAVSPISVGVTSPAVASSASPPIGVLPSVASAPKVATATAKLVGTTAKVSIAVPSILAKTCSTKTVGGKKVSTCKASTISVSVSGGASKSLSAKSGTNALTITKAKKGAIVTVKVNGKVIKKIKL